VGSSDGLTADEGVITFDGSQGGKGIEPRSLRAVFRFTGSDDKAGFCIRWGGSYATSDLVLFQPGVGMTIIDSGSIVATVAMTVPVGSDFLVEIQRIKRNACDGWINDDEEDQRNHYLHLRIADLDQYVTYDFEDPDARLCGINHIDLDGWPFTADGGSVSGWGFAVDADDPDNRQAYIREAWLLAEPRIIRTDWRNPDAELETPTGTLWYPSEEAIAPSGKW